jgi:hypothetical protein
MSLMQLVYVSRALIGDTPGTWQPQLERIVSSARDLNAQNNITGYLMFDGVEFAQILEGSEGSVMGTFLRIASDRKHENMNVLSRGIVRQRQFADWKMGLAVRDNKLEDIFRSNGFIKPGDMSDKPLEPVLHLAMQLSRNETIGQMLQ